MMESTSPHTLLLNLVGIGVLYQEYVGVWDFVFTELSSGTVGSIVVQGPQNLAKRGELQSKIVGPLLS